MLVWRGYDTDTIDFNIPGGGVQTILLNDPGAAPLPTVTGQTIIDGYTQPGASANTNAGFASAFAAGGVGSNATLTLEIDLNDRPGLVISGGNSVVRGVAIWGVQERFDRMIQLNPFLAREIMRMMVDRIIAMNKRLSAN